MVARNTRVAVMTNALAEARDMVKVGPKAKDSASAEARDRVKVGTKAKDSASAEARDRVKD